MAPPKQNNPGLGIEYEVYVPAYFALLLNKNPEFEDFTLRSNVEEIGNLDDLLIDIKTKSGENLYFAFQLKHKENLKKNLLATYFEAKGDFNLEKYCEAFKKLNEENKECGGSSGGVKKKTALYKLLKEKYHFILYTNQKFDPFRKNEAKKFSMTQDEYNETRSFFDTSGGSNNLYKFEVKDGIKYENNVKKEDYDDFFSKFSLYTGQADIAGLVKSIKNDLKYEESYSRYLDFFRRWHRGDFTNKIIDKKTLNVHLVDILLPPPVAIKNHLSDGQDGNSIFFETMVQQFDVTIVDASKQDFIELLEEKVRKYPEEFNSEKDMIRFAQDNKFLDRSAKKLTEETKSKLLHYFFQKPLILDFNADSKNQIYEASKLCKLEEIKIKLVIMGKDIDVSNFSHLKMFRNLTEVDGSFLEETKKKCKLSLQGRNISLEEIFEDEIREFVTPREIFQMLKGSLSIGEDKEKLPEYYIPRTVSATVFDIESIIKHSHESLAIIFYFEGKFDELKILKQNIVDREDYFYEDFLGGLILRKKEPSKKPIRQDNSRDIFPEIPAIILRKEECSREQFDEICEVLRKEERSKKGILKETSREETHSNKESEKKDGVHLFQVDDEKRCLLLMSTKNIFFKENYKPTKIPVEENNIHVFFNKSINTLYYAHNLEWAKAP